MIFYRWILVPGAAFFLQCLGPFLPQKLRQSFALRQQKVDPKLFEKLKNKKVILIHASSGEIEYAKALIKKISTERPELSIVVSYSSVSAVRLHKDINALATLPLPWDSVAATSAWLDTVKPEMIIFCRTDFWPEFVCQAKKKRIPMFAIAAKEKALQPHWVQQNIEILSVKNFGDPRADRVRDRLNARTVSVEKFRKNDERKLIVLGSLWPEDWKIWQAVVTNEINRKDFRWILVPHEIESSFAKNLAQDFSQTELGVEVVNQIGLLAQLYTLADLAFVGGSFKKRVHSLLEPWAAGLPIVVGPHCENQPETELLRQTSGFFICQNSADLQMVLDKISVAANLELKREKVRRAFEFDQHLGASCRIFSRLFDASERSTK